MFDPKLLPPKARKQMAWITLLLLVIPGLMALGVMGIVIFALIHFILRFW